MAPKSFLLATVREGLIFIENGVCGIFCIYIRIENDRCLLHIYKLKAKEILCICKFGVSLEPVLNDIK